MELVGTILYRKIKANIGSCNTFAHVHVWATQRIQIKSIDEWKFIEFNFNYINSYLKHLNAKNSLWKYTIQVNWQICISLLFWKWAKLQWKERKRKLNAKMSYFFHKSNSDSQRNQSGYDHDDNDGGIDCWPVYPKWHDFNKCTMCTN